MDWAEDWAEQWISRLAGLEAPILFAVNFFANTFPMPGWPIPVAAGVLLGFLFGFALVFVSGVGGATAAFLLSRHVLRKAIEKRIRHFPRVKAIDGALRDKGWKAVVLLQLMPFVPFGLQNYVLGASRVKFGSFLAGTALGVIPSAAFYVGVGTAGRYLAGDESPWKWVVIGLGILASFAFMFLVGRAAKRRMSRYSAA